MTPLRLALIMWAVFGFEQLFHLDFGFLGVRPWSLPGLIGVFTMPLIHGSLAHIISNTLPLVFLGTALYFFYDKIANQVFLQCYFLTNFLVWLIGRSGSSHIGASGLIYGLAAFLISFGFFRKDFKSIVISIIAILFYGGLAYGVLPINPHISWEAHLMGAVVGVGAAFGMSKLKRVSSD